MKCRKHFKMIIIIIISCVLLFGCTQKDSSPDNSTIHDSDSIKASNTDFTSGYVEPTLESTSDIIEPLVYYPLEKVDSLMDNDSLFYDAMEIVRKNSYDYANSCDNANLLLCQYYRSKRDKFVSLSWNMLSGNIDYDFINQVEGDADVELLRELTNRSYLIEPVNDEHIELTHFFASLNILIYHRQMRLTNGNSSMNYYVYDMGTWAGDCLELAADILALKTDEELDYLTDEELDALAEELLGVGGHFGRDNMLADVDTFNIASNMKANNTDILELISEYYTDLQENNYPGYRFALFLSNRYGANSVYEEAVTKTENVLLSGQSIHMGTLRKKFNINIENNAHARVLRSVAKAFVSYLYEQ